VLGAGGRMGTTVCRAVSAAEDLELAAAVDPAHAGERAAGSDLLIGQDPACLVSSAVQVAVDFTNRQAAMEHLRLCAAAGIHAVVGTTGLGPEDLEEVKGLFEGSPANCVVAANFAIGAAVMVRLAELAAPYLDACEIVELHHQAKADAPSGTALATAAAVAAARQAAGAGPFATGAGAGGARGEAGPGGVRLHSVRLPGLVSHQEVLFGSPGQSLTLRHDSYDRDSFVPGVLLAVRSVASRPGTTVGLGPLLGF